MNFAPGNKAPAMSGPHHHHDHHHHHDQGHHHDHGHRHAHGPAAGGHGHHHAHASTDFGRAFMLGIALNVIFIVIEVAFGILGNSMALLADAGHNLSDVIGLVIAWIASTLSKRAPSTRFTYGLRNTSILAALANALLLLVAVGAIAWEAVQRFWSPEPVQGTTMMVVAAIGIAINGGTAMLFASGRKGDINIRGAFLHMAADAAVSAGVVLAGLGIIATGWLWLDPLASLAIAVVIVWGTWGLFKDSMILTLAAVPPGVNPDAVNDYLAGLPGVAAVHDLHIWAMSTTETALTAHLVMPAGHPGDNFLIAAGDELGSRFRIGHATLQIEISPETACKLSPADVI